MKVADERKCPHGVARYESDHLAMHRNGLDVHQVDRRFLAGDDPASIARACLWRGFDRDQSNVLVRPLRWSDTKKELDMVRRILIATDGSRLSRRAITQGVALAKATGATVVGFHALVPSPIIYYADPMPLPASTIEAFERDAEDLAVKNLKPVEVAAAKAGVPFKGACVRSSSPADALIRTATKEKCDLIVMASHGRSGVKRVLLGSETNTVLTHSRIPVLVTR